MDLAREAIEYGSIFNVLKDVSALDILETIVAFIEEGKVSAASETPPPSDREEERLVIAYKAACDLLHPNKHFLRDGTHIITKLEKYPAIGTVFIVRGGDVKLPSKPDGPPLVTFLADALIKYHQNLEIRNYYGVAVEKNDSMIYFSDLDASILLRYRNYREVSEFGGPTVYPGTIETAIEFDVLELLKQIPLQKSHYTLMMEHCQSLATKAPKYWPYVQKAYADIFTKNLRLLPFTRKELKTMYELFPSIPGNELMELSELAYRIFRLDPFQRAYVLGYPLSYGLPKQDAIMKALRRLSEVGIEKYVEEVVAYNKTQLYRSFPGPFGLEEKFPNNLTDVVEGNIYEYNLFDLYPIYDDGHYYVFVRHEFPHIIKSKKHLYMQTPLSEGDLSGLVRKQKLAQGAGLHRCRTLSEMLWDLEKGAPNVFQETPSTSKQSEAQPPISPLRGIQPIFRHVPMNQDWHQAAIAILGNIERN